MIFKQYIFFGDDIYSDKINIDEAEMNQSNLLENMVKFNKKNLNQKQKKVRLKIKILLIK